MIFAELIERTKRLAGAGAPSPDAWARSEFDLAACVALAIHEVAMSVMRDDHRRALLQQDYSVDLDAAGEGDLLTASGAITNTADVLLEGVHLGAVRDSDGNILQPLRHQADFYSPQYAGFGYYLLAGRRIKTRARSAQVTTPDSIQGAASPVIVTASFSPTNVLFIPLELEDDLVRALAMVVARKAASS